MKRILATSLFVFIFILNVVAQSGTGNVSGSVVDNTGKPISSATISLVNVKDSSLVKISITAKDGKYLFEKIKDGNYRVVATSVGYVKLFSEPFLLSADKSVVDLQPLQLQEAAKGLAGVTVNAKKAFIETKIDKTIVNVEASPTSAGATALEVLEKSPGVTVDNDGNISLRGKAGVIVMMDGKPTFLSPSDLANLLKNTPATAIDQIEIMTNPSAKYDASGNSGVINFKTKKGKVAGFNGSITLGATASFFTSRGTFYVTPKTQNSFNFNYRKNKINFFGNYNPNVFRGRSDQSINRIKLAPDQTVLGYNDVDARFKFGNNNHSIKLGLDYFANKNTTYGVVVNGFIFSGHPTPVTRTTTADENHQLLATLVSLTNNKIKFKNFSSNFNYRHVFDTLGTEITADVDYITYNNVSNVKLTTDFYDGNNQSSGNSLLLQGYIPSDIHIYSFKSDYAHPLKKGGRIEAGIKSSFVKNDNLVDYKRWDGAKFINDSRSNHFIYDENINAIYINANKQFGKWSLQTGLRLENTIAKGYQVTNDSTFKRNFTNLFPSAFISYEANKSSTLTFSYSRRVNRANYQDLNPFIFFLDSLSYRQGNPFLLPQFSHNFELSHSFKGKLITTINYNTTSNIISQIIKPFGDIVYLTPDNVAKFNNYGLAITAPFPVTKWWNMNFFGNIYNNHYKGIYNNEPLDISYTSFLVNMTQTFTIKKGFTAEISGFYRGKGVDQLNISQPLYVVSFGAQKLIMKGKGTLRLNLRDPFWLQQYRGQTKIGIVDTKIHNKQDSRQVTGTFTWRFGKNGQPGAAPRRRASASQDEQNRVGGAQ